MGPTFLELLFWYCSGPFLQFWVGLPPAVLSPSVLSKGVEIGPTATHFGPTCAQTMPRFPSFGHKPMAGRAAAGKLWQANIIKITQEIVDKLNKRERQKAPRRPKVEK